MLYISTRGAADGKTFADITFEGLARDGGLYVPENYPKFTADELAQLRGRDFQAVALEVLSRFWTQLPQKDLWQLCRDAWQPSIFPNGWICLRRTMLRRLHGCRTVSASMNFPTAVAFDQ